MMRIRRFSLVVLVCLALAAAACSSKRAAPEEVPSGMLRDDMSQMA